MRHRGGTYDTGQAGVNGWIKLWRQVFDHPVVGIASGLTAHWMDLVALAAVEPTAVWDGQLERGQAAASLRYLADRWVWSIKRVRSFLDHLERCEMIRVEIKPFRGTRQNVITICNYGDYQDVPAGKGTRGAQQGHAEGTKVKKVEDRSTSPNGEDATNAKRARTVKSLLPDDWMLPSEWRQWAERDAPGMASLISREADKFRDHWRTTAGRKADWAATWRNWWRRAVDMAPRKVETFTRPNTRTVSTRDTSESIGDYTARMIREGKFFNQERKPHE
jgi:hypothetical protein